MSRKKMGRKNAVQLKNEKVIIRIKLILLKGTKSDKRLDQQKRDKIGASVRVLVLRMFLLVKGALRMISELLSVTEYGPIQLSTKAKQWFKLYKPTNNSQGKKETILKLIFKSQILFEIKEKQNEKLDKTISRISVCFVLGVFLHSFDTLPTCI